MKKHPAVIILLGLMLLLAVLRMRPAEGVGVNFEEDPVTLGQGGAYLAEFELPDGESYLYPHGFYTENGTMIVTNLSEDYGAEVFLYIQDDVTEPVAEQKIGSGQATAFSDLDPGTLYCLAVKVSGASNTKLQLSLDNQ